MENRMQSQLSPAGKNKQNGKQNASPGGMRTREWRVAHKVAFIQSDRLIT